MDFRPYNSAIFRPIPKYIFSEPQRIPLQNFSKPVNFRLKPVKYERKLEKFINRVFLSAGRRFGYDALLALP